MLRKVFADGGVAGDDVVLVEEPFPNMPGGHHGIGGAHCVDQRPDRVQPWRRVGVLLARWWCRGSQGVADGASMNFEPLGQGSDGQLFAVGELADRGEQLRPVSLVGIETRSGA